MGWATWKDRWKKYYDPNIKDWPSKKKYFLNNCKLKEERKDIFHTIWIKYMMGSKLHGILSGFIIIF